MTITHAIRTITYYGLFIFLSLPLSCNVVFASIHKHLWTKWSVHNPRSEKIISHHEWQDFLNCCVVTTKDGINLVDYPHLTKQQHQLLRQYISRMSDINIKAYNRQEQLAYWINLYNALTVKIIAHYYPVSSVQDINISPGLFSVGPWGANIITIDDSQLSLDDIQNRIIRAIWNDPRTHYALNNGTIGAPNLSKYVYDGHHLNDQLNEAASSYINSLRGAQIINKKLVLSKQYEWFLDDFGGTEQDVVEHLLNYTKPALHNQLQQVNTVSAYTYNWHLNSTASSS